MQHHQPKTLSVLTSFVTTPSLAATLKIASGSNSGIAINEACHRITVFSAFALVTVFVALFCRPLAAQVDTNQPTQTEVDPANIERQISRLGDADPSIRLAAQAELLRLGAAAIGGLEKAATFKTTLDYETQIAATKILASIRDTVAIEKTDKFIQGKATLTGWPAFEKSVGDSPESRSLFRDIYLRNRTEITKALRPTADGNLVSYDELRPLLESPDLEQVCWGMFLLARQQKLQNEAQRKSELPLLPERLSKMELEQLLNTLALPTSPLTKLRTEIVPVTLLVRAIIETAPPEHPVISAKLNLVSQINSPEIGALLVQFATPENPIVVRALAITHAIKIGDAKNFAQFQPYLNDDTVIGKFLANSEFAEQASNDEPADRAINEVQVRDLVLLGNLRLADKAHTDFGFNLEAVNMSNNKIDIRRAGFANNKDREQAFERYQSSTQ